MFIYRVILYIKYNYIVFSVWMFVSYVAGFPYCGEAFSLAGTICGFQTELQVDKQIFDVPTGFITMTPFFQILCEVLAEFVGVLLHFF